MNLIKNAYSKVKNFFTLVNYPYSADKEYDDQCNEAFLKFLDYTYYILVGCFAIFGTISLYFFAMHVL